jgi:GTPase SAR1 family protein
MNKTTVRILVCGDAFVGKTTLIDVLCGEYNDVGKKETNRRLITGAENSTVGCYINVRDHAIGRNSNSINDNNNDDDDDDDDSELNTTHYRRGNGGGWGSNNSSSSNSSRRSSNCNTIGVEFVEVGGSRQYALSRSVFYANIHGIMLVHDVTNVKSLHSLSTTWLQELAIADSKLKNSGGISAIHQFGNKEDDLSIIDDGVGKNEIIGSSDTGHNYQNDMQQRLSSKGLSIAQLSMLQRIPVLVVGNKINSFTTGGSGSRVAAGGGSTIAKVMSSSYEEEVRSIVFSKCGGGGDDHRCIVIDAYNEAEDATSYRNGGNRLENILRFIDHVCISSGQKEKA